MAYYYYSISTYFQGDRSKVDLGKLSGEIVSAGLDCIDLRIEGDNVRVGISSALDGPGETTLTATISAHRLATNNSTSFQINKPQITSTDYKLLGKIRFPADSSYTIFKAIAYGDGTAYSLRVFDHLGSAILAESTFTNTEDHDIVTIGSSDSLTQTVIEIQGKVGTSGAKAYLDTFIVEWA